MFSICKRRHSRAGSRPPTQACSQSRHFSLGENLSITSSRMSPSVSVLSKSKNRTGLSIDLGTVMPRRKRSAKTLQAVGNRAALEIGRHHVVGVFEQHQLAPRRPDPVADEFGILRAGHV